MAAAPLRNISYTHEALINWMLENPDRPLRDAAAYFGYTQAWISTVIHSDIFQAKLGARQEAVFAQIATDIPSKLRTAANIALERVTLKLEETEDAGFLLDATDKLLHRMGFAPNGSLTKTINMQVSQTSNTFLVSSEQLAAARALIKQPEPETALVLETLPNHPDYVGAERLSSGG